MGFDDQTQAISTLRASAPGVADDQGVKLKGVPNIVPAANNGFFPSKMSGAIV